MRPSFPYRKPRDLYPELVQRLQQDLAAQAANERLAVDRAAERLAAANQSAHTQTPDPNSPPVRPSSEAFLGPAPESQPAQELAPEPMEEPIQQPMQQKATPVAAVKSASTPLSSRKHRYSPRFRKISTKASQPPSDPERHARKCSICNHPERDAIDFAFLQWRSPDSIALTFQLTDRRVIFRHASATGLYARRRLNFRCALENILERGDQINVSGLGFVAAIRAYALLDDAGHWNEPVKRAVVTNEYVHPSAAKDPAAAPAESPASSISNQPVLELETNLTHTK